MNRRDFIKTAAALPVSVLGNISGKKVADIKESFMKDAGIFFQKVSKVVFSRDDSVRDSENNLRKDVVSVMLDKIIKELYGVKNARDGWRQIAVPSDVVGIKVNCLAGVGASTHRELVDVIIGKIIDAGISDNRILVWDRMDRDLKKAGYRLNHRGTGPLCFGNDAVGYEEDITLRGSVGSQLSKILTKYCSAIINVPILKDHGIVGYTGALKNYFGAINNPNKYHDNAGDPFIADLNTLEVIRNKTRITIMDALATQYEGGPSYLPYWNWQSNLLGASRDMVALDFAGLQIIGKKRKEEGIMSLEEAGRKPEYIFTAADEKHRLGNADSNYIDIIYI